MTFQSQTIHESRATSGDGMPLAGKSILKSLYSLFNFSRYGIDFFARFL